MIGLEPAFPELDTKNTFSDINNVKSRLNVDISDLITSDDTAKTLTFDLGKSIIMTRW